jgi:hypothetical protein
MATTRLKPGRAEMRHVQRGLRKLVHGEDLAADALHEPAARLCWFEARRLRRLTTSQNTSPAVGPAGRHPWKLAFVRFAGRTFHVLNPGAALRSRPRSQQVQRCRIRSAAIKFRNGVKEYRIPRDSAEKRHRRAEFEVVRTSQDVLDCPALHRIDERRAFPQPASQNLMLQVGD